ncbi:MULTISPECIES: hypothetical protein [unclassified Rhodococcus (in: high G+C Gram-positive bacteria)]|uniref:hypothetical protein n=1 Tax=unclassified Rhodococcus (in: high G+C Gram-positive bacteria) TaxID=192944 RepID=UPI00096AA75E|nr:MULTISPECIES: hypothetical protein [unclassified Rhodococcus (in: high G+C Gram-positive bacteria)]
MTATWNDPRYGEITKLDVTEGTRRKRSKQQDKAAARRRKLEFAIVETLRRHPNLTRGEIHKQLTEDRVPASLAAVVAAVDRLSTQLRITYELQGTPAVHVYRPNEGYYYGHKDTEQ